MAVIRPFVIGFATTLKHLFKKPITVNYPEQKFPMFPKFRGKQVLMRDENGLEKCVACGLCSAACPADAIYLEAAENDGTVQAGPRYASVYQIHKTRCIFCGYCEEACPVGAIATKYTKTKMAPARFATVQIDASRQSSRFRSSPIWLPILGAYDGHKRPSPCHPSHPTHQRRTLGRAPRDLSTDFASYTERRAAGVIPDRREWGALSRPILFLRAKRLLRNRISSCSNHSTSSS